MLPHEGYNMLYAQGMGDESYGGGYALGCAAFTARLVRFSCAPQVLRRASSESKGFVRPTKRKGLYARLKECDDHDGYGHHALEIRGMSDGFVDYWSWGKYGTTIVRSNNIKNLL
jgi:hypothetical protein